MTIHIIDPHLHLVDRSRGDYHWLNTENPPFWPDKSLIQQDVNLKGLTDSLANISSLPLVSEIKLSAFVHIEAGFDNAKPWRELAYVESLAHKNMRTIAAINLLTAPKEFKKTLQKLQDYPSLIGARHILDEHAYAILSSNHAQKNIASLNAIADFIFELQLPLALSTPLNTVDDVMAILVQTIEKNSQLRFILNHAGFPPKAANSGHWLTWQKNIATLAKLPNVFIKCSGLEMTERHYDMSWFSQLTSYCISQFSIDRVMLASNFPLCLLSHKNYGGYWQDILNSSLITQCSEHEKSALLYGNALKIYRL